MANIKSQKKRNKQNEVAHERNKAIRSGLKTEAKKARAAVAAGDEGSTDLVRATSRSLDKAVSKGVLHKKTAARRKSRLAKSAAKTSA
jgi:small subunit ribosomal protein S20